MERYYYLTDSEMAELEVLNDMKIPTVLLVNTAGPKRAGGKDFLIVHFCASLAASCKGIGLFQRNRCAQLFDLCF